MRSIVVLASVVSAVVATTRAQPESPRFVATQETGGVYAEFALHPQTVDDLSSRLSQLGSRTSVLFMIGIKRRASFWKDRSVARGQVRVSAQRIGNTDTYVLARTVNGQFSADGVRDNRAVALGWLTSFPRVRLYDLFQLDAQPPYAMTISAIIEGGSQPRIETPIIAHAELQ